MSTVRKVGLLAVSVISCGLLSTGCSSAQTNTGSSSSAQSTSSSSSSPVSVSMYEPDPSGVVNMNTNWFTKYAEKTFHMKITWDLVDTSDASTKQNLLLESGDYPDVFWDASFTPAQELLYGQEGIFKPLNSLIKEYAPNVWHAIQTNAAFRQAAVAPNGNIYGLPYYNVCTHCNWSQKMWINGYWLKKLNLPLPTTTAQFEQVLEDFKEHGIVPLTGYTNGWNSNPVPFLMNAFIYDDNTDFFDVNNGKVTFAADQPQWKAGLEYIHDLYQKGLLSTTAFTQTSTQVTELVAQNKVGAMPGGTASAFPGDAGVPWQYWMNTVPPLKGPNGTQYATFSGNIPTGACFAITNKASDAQAIAVLKLVNFLYTPQGLQMANYGPAGGQFWNYAKKGQKGLSGQQAFGYINNVAFSTSNQNLDWSQEFPMYQDLNERNNSDIAWPPYSDQGSQSMLQLVTEEDYAGHQPKQVYPGNVWMPAVVAQQYALEQTNINDYVTTWTTNFILGRDSLTTDWNQYVQGLNGLGLSQYLELAQKYMGTPFSTNSFTQDLDSLKYLLSIPETSSDVKWVVTPPQYTKYESWAKH